MSAEPVFTLCVSRVVRWEKRRLYCPTCQKSRTMLREFYEGYGWHECCLSCGEAWADGERMPRPFAPGWRQKNIERARKRIAKYRSAVA